MPIVSPCTWDNPIPRPSTEPKPETAMKRLQLFITLTLSALLIGFLGFYEPGEQQPVTEAQMPERQVDSYMVNALSRQYDSQGQLEQRLLADRVTHYADSEHSLLANPDMLIYRQQQSPLHIQAEEGEVSADREQIWLRRNVVLTEQQPEAMTLLTEFLRVELDRDYAETDLPVRLNYPQGRKDAVGMQAYLAEDRVLLLDEVRSYHEPRR